MSTIKNQLLGKDTLLLLSEPTSASDMAQQITAMNAVREIARNGGTLIAVMHDLNLVSCFADCVVLMKQGAVLNLRSPEDALQPRHLDACFDCQVSVDSRESDA